MRHVVLLSLVLVFALCGVARAQAPPPSTPQPPPPSPGRPRADRALFGGGVGNMEQVLSASSSVGVSFYEQLGPSPADAPVGQPSSTLLSLVSGQVSYALSHKYISGRISGGGLSNYYREPTPQWLGQYYADAAASTGRTWQISPKARLTFGETLIFQPSFYAAVPSFGQIPIGDPTVPPGQVLPPDVAAFDGQNLMSTTTASFTYAIARRVSPYGNYTLEQRWVFGRPDPINFLGQSVAAGLSFGVTRYLSVRGGYYFSDSRNGPIGSPHVRSQGADIGFDFNRGGSIRLSRRTLLAFGGGLNGLVDSLGVQRYFVLGQARLTHDIGRTWSTSAYISRNLDFSSLFQEPTLSDNVGGNFGGLIASRLSFSSGVSYSRGTVGFVSFGHGTNSANAYLTLQAGMTRYLALGTSYGYYYRSIGELVVVPEGLARHSEGRVFSAYLSAWAPLFHRMRRPNATR